MTLDSQLRARRDLYALHLLLKAGRVSITEAHDKTRLILNRCSDKSVEARAVELGLIRRQKTWAEVKAEIQAEGQPEVRSDKPLSVNKQEALDRLHASRRGFHWHPPPPPDVAAALAFIRHFTSLRVRGFPYSATAQALGLKCGSQVRRWCYGEVHPDPAKYDLILRWVETAKADPRMAVALRSWNAKTDLEKVLLAPALRRMKTADAAAVILREHGTMERDRLLAALQEGGTKVAHWRSLWQALALDSGRRFLWDGASWSLKNVNRDLCEILIASTTSNSDGTPSE